MVNKERLIDTFLQLVKIDSVSREEEKMAKRLASELKELGYQVKEDGTDRRISGNAGNIIASISGHDSYPKLLFSAHMDRVEPGKGVEPEIKGEYIYSRGETVLGGDDLIGVSAILETLRILKEKGIKHGPIKVIFSVAEEIGLLGAKNVKPEEIKGIDYGLVYDVDGEIGTIVHEAPSQVKIKAEVKGKAAHAGIEPQQGISAIKIASKAISDMRLGRIDEETTANIGVIRGGRATNIIPDHVELEGECRSHSDSKLQKQVEHMEQKLRDATKKYGGKCKIDTEHLYSAFSLEKDHPLIKLVAGSARKLGYPVQLMASGGGSDANVFNKKGLPTVNLGVGMENVHSTEERVKIENMVKLVKLNIEIIKNSRGRR